VSLQPEKGLYQVSNAVRNWQFTGDLGRQATNAGIRTGKDDVGKFRELVFDVKGAVPFRGTARLYEDRDAVWMRAHYTKSTQGKGLAFPFLVPSEKGLHSFSYQDRTFSPPAFSTSKTCTPWLLFDDHAHSMVVSPASEFMVTTMVGDGKSAIGVAPVDRIVNIPAGFNQDSVLVFSDGIGSAWDKWGAVLRSLFHKRTPSNESDVLLKSFGYWTDNGADYYYNYDQSKGYASTLLDLRSRYREEGIPLGYMQLDSWWYQKSTNDPAGHVGGAKKNNRLPIASWNRYGGLMEYRAHPSLFPNGLSAFQHELGLPLAVHNRWMDRNSPYHDRFKISGVAAIDPSWWADTVEYLKDSGVVCYEQDWLDQIYLNSPEMASKVGIGDAFTDGMADACRRQGLSMQYCMGTPRFFLQGLKYSNLTTIRTSGDRFEPGKWADFLYVSRLAHDVGVWPWCDVFKSSETANMILSVLSAGPVGTGDAIGKESKANILKAAMPDGTIVKPDQPLVPIDATYLGGATRKQDPFIASTFTDHNGIRATYVFAFPRLRTNRSVVFKLADVGVKSSAYVYDFNTNEGGFVGKDGSVHASIGKSDYGYWMIEEPTISGIVLLGDLGKFVPTGKQRIPSLVEKKDGLNLSLRFAKDESDVVLEGVSSKPPFVKVIRGTATISAFDPGSGRFTMKVRPMPGRRDAQLVIGS